MDGGDIGAIVAAVCAALAAAWARVRKVRKGYVFRPSARVRLYASWRTHERTSKRPSSEPPPFNDREKP